MYSKHLPNAHYTLYWYDFYDSILMFIEQLKVKQCYSKDSTNNNQIYCLVITLLLSTRSNSNTPRLTSTAHIIIFLVRIREFINSFCVTDLFLCALIMSESFWFSVAFKVYTHIRRSEDAQDIFWTSYVRSIYVLCPGGVGIK